MSLKEAQSNERGRLAARRRKGFLGRESALVEAPRFQPQVPTPWVSFLSKASFTGHPGNCKHDVKHYWLCAGPITSSSLSTSFLWEGTKWLQMSPVWREISAGVTARGLHLPTVTGCITCREFLPPHTQRTRKKKKVLNSWLNLIYIFHSVFLSPVVFYQSPFWHAIKRKPYVYKQ